MFLENLQKLKALAQSATAGEWHHYRHGVIKGGPVIEFVNGSSQQQIALTTGTDWMRADEQCANADFIAAANPAAVLELIKEVERGQRMLVAACVGLGSIGEALGAEMDDDADALRGMVNDLKAENISLRLEVEKCTETLPGVTYMDPPDGGSPKVAEQLSRMAKDAARYRWTSIEGNWVARMFGKWRAHIGEYGEASPTNWYETREEAIDAAMAHEVTQPLNPA